VSAAVNAIIASRQPQTFLGINEEGCASVVTTTGNRFSHLILRGGDDGPNHDEASVNKALAALQKSGLPPRLMIDASHQNCAKDCRKMPDTFREIVRQRAAGNAGIIGAMLESHLVAGAQSMGESKDTLVYGQSITDQCIDWAMTEELLREAAAKLA
jgi:3-deoxy-7-phosphoheptulonate synthase